MSTLIQLKMLMSVFPDVLRKPITLNSNCVRND